MKELIEIYEVLKDVGLCDTQGEFSQQWLGRSSHYVSQINGDPRKASLTSLRLLTRELELIAMIAKQAADRPTYRKVRGAWVLSRTITNAVYEIRHVPRHNWITAC